MHILFGILNWGLGHATRTEPLIREAESRGRKVTIATWGSSLKYLQASFPRANFIDLQGPDIRYGSHVLLSVQLLFQAFADAGFPSRIRSLVREVHKKDPIHRVFSDNLPWMDIPGVRSVYMTHQLNIPTPRLLRWVNGFHRRWMSRFDEIWVPDRMIEPRLSGGLSKVERKDIQPRYVGWLSRWEGKVEASGDHLLILLSGPEPARTQLERKLIRLLSNEKMILIRGVEGDLEDGPEKWEIHGRLGVDSMQPLLARSKGVIARSGYSTLMDLIVIGVPAILIPTPGQTEQEYLADHLKRLDWFEIIRESDLENLDLERAKNPNLSIRKGDLADPAELLSLLECKGES
ncbi:MAG: hypothetical protein LPK80_04410 [Bacteroidota bacterium]|nr:hypothetical protein [Bacteroidota bacterium]